VTLIGKLLSSVNKYKQSAIALLILCAATIRAEITSDPFAFNYADASLVASRLDDQAKTLKEKAEFIVVLKSVERFEVGLLDPAAIEKDVVVTGLKTLQSPEEVNRLKLALLGVLTKSEETPFCFYPNYRIVGLSGDVRMFSLTIALGCGVYKTDAGAIQFSDGFSNGKSLDDFLNSILPMRIEDRDLAKVSAENAKRIISHKSESETPTPR
jgi:hypothetical protein